MRRIPTGRRWTIVAAAAFGATALGMHSGPAQAASISVSGSTLTFTGDKGEANNLTVSRGAFDPTFLIVDSGARISAGAGCGSVSADGHTVRCSAAGVSSLTVGGGDQDDVLRVDAPTPALLSGGTESDVLIGGDGDDTLNGGGGEDRLDGAKGADVMDGGSGTDTADYRARVEGVVVTLDDLPGDGTPGAHLLPGENDNVRASVENVLGGAGRDSLTGNAAANALDGGRGGDRLEGKLGPDLLSGGGGGDTVSYSTHSTGVTADIDGAADDGAPNEGDTISTDVENLAGSPAPDALTGDGKANRLDGDGGSDTLLGGDGDDVMDGDAGADLMDGEGGQDTVTYADRTDSVQVRLDDLANDGHLVGNFSEGDKVIAEQVVATSAGDHLFAGADAATFEGLGGDDFIEGGQAGDTLDGGAGNDTLRGNGGADIERGADGQDILIGHAGADDLDGGPDNDTFDDGPGSDHSRGGDGDDEFVLSTAALVPSDNNGADDVQGDAGIDLANYGGSNLPVTVKLNALADDGVAGEGDFVHDDVENISGGHVDDLLRGSSAANTLNGQAGADDLDGLGGPDVLIGKDGADELSAIDGFVDQLDCGAATDTISFEPFDLLDPSCP